MLKQKYELRTFFPNKDQADTLEYKKLQERCARGDILSVAVIGSNYAGKSTYVAMLIRQMKECSKFGLRCYLDHPPADYVHLLAEDSWNYYNKYYDECFNRGIFQLADDTYSHLEWPLLTVNKSTTHEIEFSVLDVPNHEGENEYQWFNTFSSHNAGVYRYKNEYGLVSCANAQGIAQSINAIILMIDPFSFVQSKNNYGGEYCYSSNGFKETNTIIAAMENGLEKLRGKRERIDIPVAICLPKVDVMKRYGLYANDVEVDCIVDGKFNYSKSKLMAKQVRKFFKKVSVDIDSFARKHFQHYNLFAINSITTTGSKDNKYTLESHGVLSPIAWLLAEYGFIESSKH